MKKNIKLLLPTLAVTTLLFTACGGGVDNKTSDKTTLLLNSTNYVTIAKKLYAEQEGKSTRGTLATSVLKAPTASREKDTLYISRVEKPRDFKIEKMELLYNDKKLTIDVDSSSKYATISFDGKSTKVNFREFTASN